MLGDAILYAARRVTSTAIENVERKAAWAAAASAFLMCALVSALIVAYQFLEPRISVVNSVAAVSAACLLVGLICLSLPNAIERAERHRTEAERKAAPAVAAVATVDQEARSALDYFGALRVVGAAFLFGLGAARKLKN